MPEWLLHNPIADMRGPAFLGLYAVTIVATLIVCAWLARTRDHTGTLPPPPVPPEPDPFEIAYLRGGEREAVQVALLSLVQRGYLRITDDRRTIERAAQPPDTRHLSRLERNVFGWLSQPTPANKLFQGQLPTEIRKSLEAYQGPLEAEQLLAVPEARRAAYGALLAGLMVVLGLGGYKLLIALAKGRHNVLFLVLLGLLGAFLLLGACLPDRLSRRGKAYLEQLKTAFEKLRTAAGAPAAQPSPSGATPATDLTPLLLLGVFGAGALATTAYADYHHFMRRVQESAGGASSCSSGGSCGSSCGGGCGGGCGGCGG